MPANSRWDLIRGLKGYYLIGRNFLSELTRVSKVFIKVPNFFYKSIHD